MLVSRLCFDAGIPILKRSTLHEIQHPLVELRLDENFQNKKDLIIKSKIVTNAISEFGLSFHGNLYDDAVAHAQTIPLNQMEDIYILKKCRNIKSLTISQFKNVKDSELCNIFQSCSNLKAFSLRNCERITDDGFNTICLIKRNLECLEIISCPGISDLGIARFLKLSRKLKRFFLMTGEPMSRSLKAIFESCHTIEHLIFRDGAYFNTNVACPFKLRNFRCVNIKKLALSGIMTSIEISLIAKHCRSLEDLEIGCSSSIKDEEFARTLLYRTLHFPSKYPTQPIFPNFSTIFGLKKSQIFIFNPTLGQTCHPFDPSDSI